MTNADVIKMVKAGLNESLIIASIKQAPKRAFSLNADSLVELKVAGVSDNIVHLMLDPTAVIAPPATPPTAAPAATAPRASMIEEPKVARSVDEPGAPHDAGIYVDVGESSPKIVPLEPTVFSQGKSGGILTSALTYGIKKAKWKAVVRGRTANLRLRTAQPVFYFYFENKGSGLSNTGGFSGWLAGASSPNEFVLAKMDQKSNARELIVGEFGMLGASSGTRSQDTVDMKIEKLSPGIYKVTPASPLKAGIEYCLFYAGGAPATLGGGTAGKLFDFGVDPR